MRMLEGPLEAVSFWVHDNSEVRPVNTERTIWWAKKRIRTKILSSVGIWPNCTGRKRLVLVKFLFFIASVPMYGVCESAKVNTRLTRLSQFWKLYVAKETLMERHAVIAELRVQKWCRSGLKFPSSLYGIRNKDLAITSTLWLFSFDSGEHCIGRPCNRCYSKSYVEVSVYP